MQTGQLWPRHKMSRMQPPHVRPQRCMNGRIADKDIILLEAAMHRLKKDIEEEELFSLVPELIKRNVIGEADVLIIQVW